MKYRRELDGLRGVAVLSVLASHAQVPGFASEGGLAGVTLFFVLSGYLITTLLVVELESSGHLDLRAFYVRRGLRLLPALFTLLIAVAVGTAFGLWSNLDGAMQIAIPTVLLYVSNWAQVAGVAMGPLGHLWSLAVEEQFYILWPLALLFALRFGNRRTVAVAAICLAVLVTPWRAQLLLDGSLGHAFAGTDAHADALLLGCAVALLKIRFPAFLGIIGVAGIVLSAALWPGGGALVFMLPLAAVFGVLAVAGCPLVLGWAPLAYVGRISYGLYLWHFLFIWWGLPWPIVLATSFVVAQISYIAIERPFLRLKDRLRGGQITAGRRTEVSVTPVG